MGASKGKTTERASAVGWMLRDWRLARGLSQGALAAEVDISGRHLSFVETGRAEPGRELLLRLSAVLGMTPRDRNALLSAAGYQPIYRETPLDAPQMAEVRRAVELILRQTEPFPAAAKDRNTDVVMCNAAFSRAASQLLGPRRAPAPYTLAPHPRLNLLRLTFDPEYGGRNAIRNWEVVARAVWWRARAELAATRDRRGKEALDELARFPGMARLLDAPEGPVSGQILPVEMEIGGVVYRLINTVTSLASPQDLTAYDLRIEAYHAADEATERAIRAAAAQSGNKYDS